MALLRFQPNTGVTSCSQATDASSNWRTGQDCHSHKSSDRPSSSNSASKKTSVQRLSRPKRRALRWDKVLR